MLSMKDKATILGFIVVTATVGIFFFRRPVYLEVEILVTHDNLLFTDPSPPFWYQEKVIVGSEEKDGIGRIVATVTDIKSYEEGGNKVDTYVKANIRTIYSRRSEKHTFRGKPVLVGSPITINPNETFIKGIITNIEGQDATQKEVIVKARLTAWNYPDLTVSGADPVYAESIHVGDKVKDMSGNDIAVVLDKQVRPGKRITTDNQGTARLIQDPYFQEVYLTLKLKVRESSAANYYMNKYKVKVSRWIPLFFQDATRNVEIIEIVDENNES